MFMNDAQQATYGFVVQQAYTVNTTVYEMKFPDLDWARLVYVDTSAPEWTPGIVTFLSSTVGKAGWFSGAAKDIPKANATRDKSEARVHMAAIGYGWNIEEAGQAQLLNMSLSSLEAEAARRAYNEFMWGITFQGDATKGLSGIVNQSAVTTGTAPADGTGSATTWFAPDGTMTKTATQILRDFNGVILGIFTGSNTVEMADTVLLPYATEAALGATPMSATNSETVLSFIERNNIYTRRTGLPLTIRGELSLDTAGAGGTKRMVAYRNAQDVVKLHLPMPHRFLPVATADNVHFDVPGIFRTGGVEVLRPAAFRYLDGI